MCRQRKAKRSSPELSLRAGLDKGWRPILELGPRNTTFPLVEKVGRAWINLHLESRSRHNLIIIIWRFGSEYGTRACKMVHSTWRTTSSKLGPLLNALILLIFSQSKISNLPIVSVSLDVQTTILDIYSLCCFVHSLLQPPNWPQLHPTEFTLLIMFDTQ